ncbi:hypothetical protein [Maricaulis sp.]|uniref:hypothetical protein n=1 Tax=Maricaulis sp. TaxID=1486257 RepID=UPI002619AFCB|nr:hypothetical protein [Maricaulis sp.]
MTRISLATLIAATLVTGTSAAAQADQYRHIMFRETPYAAYRGIHPIDAELAAGVAHYEFDYDDQGRLSRVVYQVGDQPVWDNGVWDSFIWFAPDVRVSYEAGREIHSYFNTQGERVAAHGNVYSAVYTLDENGARTALAFYDAEGEPSESEWGIHRYDWRPSDDGHVFERRYNLAGEMMPMRPVLEFYETKMEYDADGKLVFMRNYGLEGVPTDNSTGAGIDRITYDLAGNFIRWQVYDHAGNAVEGNRPGVHLGEHLYDAFGNKIGLRGFDRHGNQQVFSWGSMMTRTTYDAHGNRYESWTHGPDGAEQGRARWTYSEDGAQVETISGRTPEGELTAHAGLGGAALIRYVRDEAGAVSVERFNADMSVFAPASGD